MAAAAVKHGGGFIGQNSQRVELKLQLTHRRFQFFGVALLSFDQDQQRGHLGLHPARYGSHEHHIFQFPERFGDLLESGIPFTQNLIGKNPAGIKPDPAVGRGFQKIKMDRIGQGKAGGLPGHQESGQSFLIAFRRRDGQNYKQSCQGSVGEKRFFPGQNPVITLAGCAPVPGSDIARDRVISPVARRGSHCSICRLLP